MKTSAVVAAPGFAFLRSPDAWVVFYLGLPNLIFLVGWLRPEYGIPAALLVIACLFALCRRSQPVDAPWRLFGLALAVAVPWVILSGVGHFFYANTDWVVRDAVLVDLVRDNWPVVYHDRTGREDLLLRAPLAFYLPAALLGKVLGIEVANLLLALWTLAGVALAFFLITRHTKGNKLALIILMVFVLFSGMDGPGSLLEGNSVGLGIHLEWWAKLFQYSSNTTLLFWVPNHALPAWIATAWLLSQRKGEWSIPLAIVIVALVPLWSPLAAIGLAPLFAVAIFREFDKTALGVSGGLRALFNPWAIISCVIICGLIFPYLLIQGAPIHASLSFEDGMRLGSFLWTIAKFVVFEFLILGILLLRRFGPDPLLITSLLVLFVLLGFNFGPGNDLVMRASIPALTVLAIRLGEWLGPMWTTPVGIRRSDEISGSVAMLVFALGMFTPLYEVARTLEGSAAPIDTFRNVIQSAGRGASHYLAPANQSWPKAFLRSDQ